MNKNTKKEVNIKNLFDSIAKNYDKLNTIISLGLHKKVKKNSIEEIPLKMPSKILDLCCGTADIGIIMSKKFPDSEIFCVDFSDEMLKIAREKTQKYNNIKVLSADALDMPFDDDFFDISVISFGLRNLDDIKKGLLEMKRVTKKDGYVVNLDTGKVANINLMPLFYLFFNVLMPFLGKIFHGKIMPYKYLSESAKTFPSQKELIQIFNELGFNDIKNYDYIFGAIAQQIAKV